MNNIMNNINKIDYTIWCTYHNKNIPKYYNLHESKHFKLFNNDIFDLKEDNINYLHDYLCELVTYYYVWKNEKKSKYVGFCSYSKHFKYIDFELIDKWGFFPYFGCYFDANNFYNNLSEGSEFLWYELMLYLKYKYDINLFEYLKDHNSIFVYFHNMCIFKWNVFEDVCDFVFGFLDYICSDEKWKIKQNIDFLTKVKGFSFLSNKEELFSDNAWWSRGLAISFEVIISLFISIRYTNNIWNEYEKYSTKKYLVPNYSIICKDYITDLNKLKLWIMQNIKSGITKYIICSKYSKDTIEKSLKENNITDFSILNPYVYDIEIYNKINEYNNRRKTIMDEGFKPIELKLTEHINCDSSINMHLGKYKISN